MINHFFCFDVIVNKTWRTTWCHALYSIILKLIEIWIGDRFDNAQEKQKGREQVQVAGRAGGPERIPGEREGRLAVALSQKQVFISNHSFFLLDDHCLLFWKYDWRR